MEIPPPRVPAPAEKQPAEKQEDAVRQAVKSAEQVKVGFGNREAVRVGLFAAAIATLLAQLPVPVPLNIVWVTICLTGAGFFAVYRFNRRSGVDLSPGMGARMGWITGVFCFAIAAIIFTITIAVISVQGGLAAFYREQLEAQGAPGVDLDEALRMIENPAGVATLLMFSFFMLFFIFTLLPTLGGLMGAKVLEKE